MALRPLAPEASASANSATSAVSAGQELKSIAPAPDESARSATLETMPFKSQAQRRKFAELLIKGEISPETFEEWNRETGSKRLPERVTRKSRPAARKRTTAKKR